MKKCFKCNKIKSLTFFYKHPQMPDGYVNKCKECNKKDVKENRSAKLSYYRSYDKIRGNRQTPEYREKWRKDNLAKYQAKVLMSNLLRSKKITKGSCEECGTIESVHGHHDDYLKPFDVRWLCAAHHSQWHKTNGEGKNGKINLKDFDIKSINDFYGVSPIF